MSTVFARTFASSPARDAVATWNAIVDLLTRQASKDKRGELLAVTGIAAAIISEQAPRSAPIVVTCDGPRTRIYCLYDDDAIDASDANEDVLGYDPLNGEWAVSLPCSAADLSWVSSALTEHGKRIVARDMAEQQKAASDESAVGMSVGLVLDEKGFFGS